ncbi:MAG TPA: SMP-30/gluconolactonase/LRE family protein [Terracidiphilus sp.]|nr:SMP-30/gluconolactonase/LRE family protein [Terracidiphilus sp.]
MSSFLFNSNRSLKTSALLLIAAACIALPSAAHASSKKKTTTDATPPVDGPRKFNFDPKKLVWPSPPNIARVRWLDYFAGAKIDYSAPAAAKPKASWMDRLAGTQSDQEKVNPKSFPFQLIGPYGIAIDSKNKVYVADQKVGAIFIFDTDTHEAQLIRNGIDAHFGWINGLAIDDDDRLFVSDGKLHHIMIFNPKHEPEGQITEGLQDPVGLAIDSTNRFLYVVDTEQDQVIVYDADTYKLLRRIGTGGKNHELTSQGDFGAPQGVAVDADGNVYVTDTLNDRVEVFDADGGFISTFGKNGDGPGFFERPKGIAIDGDGHIWVADEVQDRLQVFNKDGQLLTYIGYKHGDLPGQFQALVGVAIDKQNRVFTTEQYPGRLQEFQYVNDAQAEAEKEKQVEENEKRAAQRQKAATPATDEKPAQQPAAAAPQSAASAPKTSQ